MARKKSNFLSALGRAFEIFKAIADAVIAKGGGDEDLLRILNDPGGADSLANRIATMILAGRAAAAFVIEVVYGLAFDAMVKAGGYDYVNPDFAEEHFPTQGTGTVRFEAVLVHIGCGASTEVAEAEIKRQGLIPASASELCAFGAKYPDEQRKYPIVAIGESWLSPSGRVYFPYLWRYGLVRSLRLVRDADDWSGLCRFLALRKIS